MSGDVQPRKRKDKRRKKEGGSLGMIHDPVTSHKFKRSESDDNKKMFDVPDQGEKIHVQNDHGIGGNICVKIIFFCLFGLLIGAVGLIYLQSQGSTDVDLPTIEESRFAEYFTGWLDDSTDDHEHEPSDSHLDHDHEDEHEHEDHDDHEEGEGDELQENEEKDDESPEQGVEFIQKLFGLQTEEEEEDEHEVEEKEKPEESEEKSEVREYDDDEDEEEEDDENEESKEDDKQEEVEDEDEEIQKESEEEKNEDEETQNESEEEKDEDSGVETGRDEEEEEDEYDASQMDESDEEKIFKKEALENEPESEEEDENDDDVEEEMEKDEEETDIDKSKEIETPKPVSNEDLGYEEIDESDEDVESSKQVEESEETKPVIEKEIKASKHEEDQGEAREENETEEEEEGGGGVAVKLGVGIALIIVAHLVLVQKWKSMGNAPLDEKASVEETVTKKEASVSEETEPVISRRQTLVPENVCLNDELEDEDEMGEEEEEEDEEEVDEENIENDDEAYSEEEEIKQDEWETFEKPVKDENREEEEFEEESEEVEEAEDEEYVEEEEEEELDEEDDYEEEEEEEEEDEEEEEEEDESDYTSKKFIQKEIEQLQGIEEPTNAPPVPPPRANRNVRGAQDFEDELIDRIEDVKEVEENAQDESSNVSGPEEQSPPEKEIRNEDEWLFRQEFDFADEQFENNPKAAVKAYDQILAQKPTLIKALTGRARALDHLAEKEKSNVYLKQAISAYKTLLLDHGHLLDKDTYEKLAERCIDRMRFGGALTSAIDLHKALIMKFPDTPKYRNTLAVTYLMLNKIPLARGLLNETLTLWPKNGFALVHYGFILKTSDNNMEEGARMLMEGIQTKEQGVIDGMFFFHLGDALNRLGRGKEAMEWYDLGVKEGLFLSRYQRSLYNVNRLKGRPWWTKEQTTYQDFFKKLEENWREIRREGLDLLNSKGVNLFKEETENLKDTGDWRQLDLFFRGRKQATCNKAPVTCSLVTSFKPASSCTRGQIKFSVMLPNTHVWPHCGPTNCRLRSHLGLVVPPKTYIRVAEETRSWEEGKFIIFDDSFEHEVWHNGTGPRLVLIVDVWHPELTNHERQTLSPI